MPPLRVRMIHIGRIVYRYHTTTLALAEISAYECPKRRSNYLWVWEMIKRLLVSGVCFWEIILHQ